MVRRAGATLLILAGAAVGLVSAVIFSYGIAGLVLGMHGGPISAIILVAIGLIPGAFSYIFIRKGIRIFRHAGQSSL